MMEFIKNILNPTNDKQTSNENMANQCDYEEILRPKQQSEKPCITVTTITQLVMQSTVDAYDSRNEGIKVGLITPEMNDMEAIAAPLSFYVFSGFEENFSPKLTLSFLDNYCLDEIKERFIFHYMKFASRSEVCFGINDFDSHGRITAITDIEGLARRGHECNLTVHHNPFKDPYRSIWIKNLS